MTDRDQDRAAVRAILSITGAGLVFAGVVALVHWAADTIGLWAGAALLLGIGAALLWLGPRGWRP